MLELACRDAVFHFNKHHLTDQETPMWVVKAKGKTYMVHHVECTMPWSTKETPDNKSTKGSIKVKDTLLTIDDENCASMRPLTSVDLARLRAKERGYTRILITWRDKVVEFMQGHGIRFTPFKTSLGGCGSRYYICDIMDPNDVTMMKLGLEQHHFRVLQENETYYKMYDDPELLAKMNSSEYEEDYVEEDEED